MRIIKTDFNSVEKFARSLLSAVKTYISFLPRDDTQSPVMPQYVVCL